MYKLPREVMLQIAIPQAAKLYDTIPHRSLTTRPRQSNLHDYFPRLRDTTGHTIPLDRQDRRASSEICGQVKYLKGIPGFTFSFTFIAITRIQPTGWTRYHLGDRQPQPRLNRQDVDNLYIRDLQHNHHISYYCDSADMSRSDEIRMRFL